MEMEYLFEMPSVNTFTMPKLRKWVLGMCQGKVLNVFGGKTKLSRFYNKGKIIHNDLNPDIDSDTHYNAMEIDYFFPRSSFDTAILDPPYTMYQAVHSYDGYRCQDITRVRNAVDKLVRSGGIVISLGYNSTGMSHRRGYKKSALLIVNSGGSHNDTMVLVEKKVRKSLTEVF